LFCGNGYARSATDRNIRIYFLFSA